MKRFFAAIFVCCAFMSIASHALADTSLMQGYEKLRKSSEVKPKQSKSMNNLLALVSYQMGNVYLSPILSRVSDAETLDGNSKMPKLGVTLTVPLGDTSSSTRSEDNGA